MRIAPPDWTNPVLKSAPNAKFAVAEHDGVFPTGFFSTTNLPTYIKVDGSWRMPSEPRMDGGIVHEGGELVVREGRRIKKGQQVLIATAEDGTEGVFVHSDPFFGQHSAFEFMASDVSREKPVNYERLASLLVDERDRDGGYPIWITGPALVHSRARTDMVWFIENGFVSALLAGNAVAVHDIEASIYGTTLGMTRTGEIAKGGHGLHMRAINRVRGAGSIAAAVAQGIITDGIMHACVTHKVPFVLTGSIRDDGPLPDVITDMVQAQDAMRRHTVKASMAVLVATALHAIATGNMLPAYLTEPNGELREVPTICVDSSEFVVSKLKDRGSHQAFGVVTNAQDFMHILRLYVEKELEMRGTGSSTR